MFVCISVPHLFAYTYVHCTHIYYPQSLPLSHEQLSPILRYEGHFTNLRNLGDYPPCFVSTRRNDDLYVFNKLGLNNLFQDKLETLILEIVFLPAL